MPLTLADLRARQFTTVRLRPGYDGREVDDFLDLVEAELVRLLRENESLRTAVASALVRPAAVAPITGTRSPALMPPPQSPPPAPRPAPDGVAGAAQVLTLAQQVADRAVAAARAEAWSVLTAARTRAEGVERAAQADADTLDRDTRAAVQTIIGNLEAVRAGLESRIQRLRALEHEHHTRLNSYLEQRLRHLGTLTGDDPPATGPVPAPPRPLHPGGARPAPPLA
ncbi:DivIVA domain-containing protein [Streptomyces sp. BE303]|uniref:DivIVA domain-containing protein n=1 Tax=Streptomyces sp. BE303 TaxID=3002528 RepID=UPI002E768D6D|nr:DivIVA domain-containing protein [Streptomyces sp. BE303]MED7947540.1 DivIVA domain-containing protein [Streptomyces sp. BE303]